MSEEKSAILGGKPTFDEVIPIVQPTLPTFEEIQGSIKEILKSKMITTAKYVSLLESQLEEFLDVNHVIAISNCTTGLIFLLKSLNLKNEIITPSFSFSATSLAILWAGLKPIFIDCHPTKWTIDPEKINKKITPRTTGILATHVFGNPCDIKTLEEICEDSHLSLIFDSAHGAGSIYRQRRIGNFGDGESFSMSPTKVLTAGEGGLVTTNNDNLADNIRICRNYGNPGNYNTQFLGLSGRLSEFNAILALKSLEMLETNVNSRHKLVNEFKNNLSKIPGISFQEIEAHSKTSYKDFTILIESSDFELSRNLLYIALEKENIMTRKYFDPPIHKQDIFKSYTNDEKLDLPITDKISKNVLSLPIYSHMTVEKVKKICKAILKIYNDREELKKIDNIVK